MIQFFPIASIKHFEQALAIAELTCLQSGEFRFEEIEIDNDELRESLMEYSLEYHDVEVCDALEAPHESYEYYLAEPASCLQHARELLIKALTKKMKHASDQIKKHYPIDISNIDSGVVALKTEISAIGQAYFWLKFYYLSIMEQDYIIFGDLIVDKRKFLIVFTEVFEFIAIFTVAAMYGNDIWMTAKSRSYQTLLDIYEEVSQTVNSGKLKSNNDLECIQKSTNDGRIDGVALRKVRCVYDQDTELYLLQATIQKNNLKEKIVTSDNIKFFDSFFVNPIKNTKNGLLIVPHEYDNYLHAECGISNCVYVFKKNILEHLGNITLKGHVSKIASDFQKKYSELKQLYL